jgi:hypothetical protein
MLAYIFTTAKSFECNSRILKYGQKVTFQKAKMMMNVEKIDEEGEGGSLTKQTAAATGQADEYFWRFRINELPKIASEPKLAPQCGYIL